MIKTRGECMMVTIIEIGNYYIYLDTYCIEGNFDGEKIWQITLQIVFGGIKFGELLRSRALFAVG